MLRGAHGRLAAIAMLAGGLSGCATTPKPVHDDERDDQTRFLCGGNYHPPTKDSLSADIVARARARCDGGATAWKRHGEVRITVQPRPDDRPWAETEQTAGLIDEDRLCAVGAAMQVLEDLWQQWHGDLFAFVGKDEVTFHVALGTPPPLFGSAAAWISRWRAALHSTEARAARGAAGAWRDAGGRLPVGDGPARLHGGPRPLARDGRDADRRSRVHGPAEPRDRSWMRVYLLADN